MPTTMAKTRGGKQQELSDTAGRSVTAILRNCLVVSYKVKHAFTVALGNPTPGYIP